LSPKYYLSFWD